MIHVTDRAGIKAVQDIICEKHYTRSVSSGKSYYLRYDTPFDEAFVVWSLPANPFISKHLFKQPGWRIWELTRLWAPDGHLPNLLTQAISIAVNYLQRLEPTVDAVISYADPTAGHHGGVYRAASWLHHGTSEETRGWRHRDGGPFVARRAFHAGRNFLRKPEIEALGYVQHTLPGKERFVRCLSRRAKRAIQVKP